MIYKAGLNDITVVTKMANIMWSNHTLDELEKEFKKIITSENSVVFIIYKEDQPIGFAKRQ